jgi:hypothetical protein
MLTLVFLKKPKSKRMRKEKKINIRSKMDEWAKVKKKKEFKIK